MEQTAEKYVEVTIQYETVVDGLAEAWAFIMSRIEKVGPDPSVHIHPAKEGPPPMLQMLMQGSVSEVQRKFHVVVEGSQKEPRDDIQSPEVP